VPKVFAIGRLAAAGCLAAMLAPPAAAAEGQPDRYTMTPADGGFVRLDKQTGAMSFCSGKEGNWDCKPMPDAEQKLQSRIGELERLGVNDLMVIAPWIASPWDAEKWLSEGADASQLSVKKQSLERYSSFVIETAPGRG